MALSSMMLIAPPPRLSATMSPGPTVTGWPSSIIVTAVFVETWFAVSSVSLNDSSMSAAKFGIVAGCYITEGSIGRTSKVRLLRDNRVIYEGKIGSLRRFKDDVSEVKQGFECGIGLERYQDVKVGDIIEAYQVEKVAGVMNG
jgi:translation initiation factor IF-2